FPTPKGIATLIARTVTIAECRLREEKQMARGLPSREVEALAFQTKWSPLEEDSPRAVRSN
ncbi:hypothetical protein Tco_0661614, partial [Tanacetum coccineum]